MRAGIRLQRRVGVADFNDLAEVDPQEGGNGAVLLVLIFEFNSKHETRN